MKANEVLIRVGRLMELLGNVDVILPQADGVNGGDWDAEILYIEEGDVNGEPVITIF